MDHWDIRYEPNALCWILMPETLLGLWKQRLRWAQGGVEVAGRYMGGMCHWRKRRMWIVLIEFLLSVLWSYVMLAVLLLSLCGLAIVLPPVLRMPGPLPGWYGVILSALCIVRFAVSLVIDRRYEEQIGRQFFWIIWYLLVFWMIGMLTTVVALPKVLARRTRTRAVWESPDRGIA